MINEYNYFKALIFSLILMSFVNLYSQEYQGKLPTLNNHTFVPVSILNPAFTNTSFSTYTGVGQTIDFRFPVLELPNGKVISVKGDVSFVDLSLGYQYQVRNWLAIYLRAKIAARLGTEIQTILSQGINTLTTFDIGWHFNVLTYDKIKMTGFFEMQKHNGNFINIWGYVEDVINDVPDASVTYKIPLLVGATGFHFAYGINDLFGLRCNSKLSWGENFQRTDNEFKYSLSVGFDVDFYKRFDVPIGIASSVMYSTQPDAVYVDNKLGSNYVFKVAYTGSPDFNLGVEYARMKVPLNYSSETPRVVNFAFVAKYFF